MQRVGARRERRFLRRDVERFAQSRLARTAPAGRGYLELLTPMHVATLYDSDTGRLRISAPFLAAGLQLGEPCILAASGDVLEAYRERLRATVGSDLEKLVVIAGPGLTAGAALSYFDEAFWAAMLAGAKRVRVVGEMACVRQVFVSEEEMLAFEGAYNTAMRRFPATVICQYDAREFSGRALLAALRAHPDIFQQPLGAYLN